MGKKLYVGNLSYTVDSSELEQLFGAHGQVVSAQIINDRDTGRSKGFGFVEMSTDAEAQAAVADAAAAAAADVIAADAIASKKSDIPFANPKPRHLRRGFSIGGILTKC